MKDMNAEKFEEKWEKLKTETLRRMDAVEEKYKDIQRPFPGMDGDPSAKERGEVNKWFSQELKKLREKYGIK